jgi:hypothetical protein
MLTPVSNLGFSRPSTRFERSALASARSREATRARAATHESSARAFGHSRAEAAPIAVVALEARRG